MDKETKDTGIMKLLRRAMVVWCVYGIVKLCILVNPLLFWVAGKVTPYYYDRSMYPSLKSVTWDSSSPEQIVCVWLIALLGAIVAGIVVCGIHYAAKAIFNERT